MSCAPESHEYWYTGGIIEPEPFTVAEKGVVMLWDAFPVQVDRGDEVRLLRTAAGLQVGAVEHAP